MPRLVDHSFDGNAKALEPGFQIAARAMGSGVNPDSATSLQQRLHECFGATTEGFVVTPAVPPGDILLSRYGRRTDQGIIDIERDSHKNGGSKAVGLGTVALIGSFPDQGRTGPSPAGQTECGAGAAWAKRAGYGMIERVRAVLPGKIDALTISEVNL